MAKQPVKPPTKGLSRQHSTCFLLEPQRVQGSDLVEMLRRICYPGAQDLKGEDFDWLCEGSEEQEFLAWLCETVDQRNIVSSEQLEAFDALLESGQPILQADELENLCKGGIKGDGEWEMEDMRSLEELEAEVQSLRALKAHRLQSRNKIESLGLTLLHNRLSVEKSEKELENSLNDTKEELLTLNSKYNATLQRLGDVVTELGQYHSTQSAGNIFLSSLDLDGYVRLEDTCWEQVEENAKSMLPVKEEDLEKLRLAREEMEKESERLRTAWASQRMQLSIVRGTLNGNKEALAWLDGVSAEQLWDPQRLPLLERKVQSLELEVEALQKQRLPGLVCEASLGVCLPAHQGWAQAEKHRLSQLAQNQVPVIEAVLGQFSRLQMVELGLQAEIQGHRLTERVLQGLKVTIWKRSCELGKRMLWQRDLTFLPQQLIPQRMDSKDHTAVRLLAMLEKPSMRKELFPKYEVLQRHAASLVQELQSLSGICHEPLPQTVSLEHDCEELHQNLCRGTQNVQLRDPVSVCRTKVWGYVRMKGGFFQEQHPSCPCLVLHFSPIQNLARSFEALLSSNSQFSLWILDFFRDLERKKLSIQTSYLDHGRQLYVLFYRDPSLLASTVEDLEQRVKDLS